MESDKTSIFSKIATIGGGGRNIQYGLFALVAVVFVLMYIYREKLQSTFESLLLRVHLGKPNEIQTTEIPPTSRLASVIEGLGLAEEIQPM